MWELNDATGGAGTGFDQLVMSGALNVTATTGNKFTLEIRSLNGTVAGNAANFSKYQDYDWIIATTSSTVAIDDTRFDLVDYVSNEHGGATVPGGGKFSIFGSGNNVHLKFTAAPEPTGMGLVVVGCFALLRRRPRGRCAA